jgi:hypothetical protein
MVLKSFWDNPNIYLIYEFNWNGHRIRPGDPIKIKRQRGSFRFTRIVANIKDNTEYCECMDLKTGKFRKFYVDQIAGPIYKRSLAKAA